MNDLNKTLVEIIRSQLGRHEEGGNNLGPDVVRYQQSTWLQPGPWPWCAAFVSWCIREWLKQPEVLRYFNLATEQAEKWRCRSANVTDWVEWARNKNCAVLDNTQPAHAGDIVVFTFKPGELSHIGFCIADQLAAGNPIQTIEGNTNNAGAADSTHGDGVVTKNRSTKLVAHYLRLVS